MPAKRECSENWFVTWVFTLNKNNLQYQISNKVTNTNENNNLFTDDGVFYYHR